MVPLPPSDGRGFFIVYARWRGNFGDDDESRTGMLSIEWRAKKDRKQGLLHFLSGFNLERDTRNYYNKIFSGG
jgi:hypothetical protein